MTTNYTIHQSHYTIQSTNHNELYNTVHQSHTALYSIQGGPKK